MANDMDEKNMEALTTPEENDLGTLTHSIIQWRQLTEENDSRKIQVRETTVKMKALETVIVRVMKEHNIGALDLKNSGGRVLFQKHKRQAAMGQKNMEKWIGEFLQSTDEAKKLMTHIQEKREIITSESIKYEKQ